MSTEDEAKRSADALIENGSFELSCAHCGETYLHHHRVIVRDRFKEDGPGAIATVENGTVNVRASAEGFLGRRSDLSVLLWCEHCLLETDLQITQTKGMTHLRTVKTAAPPVDPKLMKY
jgi:hypothetical protein